MTFDFITDSSFRDILERDFEELDRCVEAKCSKSVLILSGSIIEAILTDYFINFPSKGMTKKEVLELDLFPLIEMAGGEGLISQSTKELSTVIKNYRNLIHPGREIRKSESFNSDTADVAKSLLNIIIKEIRENYLNKIGYSASDLISKLESDALSQPIFEKILNKVHKSEKTKLYNALVEYDLNSSSFGRDIEDTRKYIRILKSQVDRENVEIQLRRMIYKIETGQKWEVLTYYYNLYEDINYLREEEIELVILYILNVFIESSTYVQSIEKYLDKNLFSTFGVYLTTDPVKKEFIKLVCKLVENHTKKDYIYFMAYDKLINSLTIEKKEKTKQYVLDNVSSYYHEKFFIGYNDGNFLPF